MSAAMAAAPRLALFFFAIFFVAGCATGTSGSAQFDPQNDSSWTGRVSVHRSDPEQIFSAVFVLSGTTQRGQLHLSSALGVSVADVRWSAKEVTLQAQGQTRHFASMEALTTELTGAALPLSALFSWLQGSAVEESGWKPDLSEWSQGRLRAQRSAPWDSAQLRVVLDEAPPNTPRIILPP